MVYNPRIHHRRSIRLMGYDYSQSGMYYITASTQNWLCLFGHVKNGKMILNDAGAMIESVWCNIPKYYSGFDVDEYVVMPNHFHGIIIINDEENRAATRNRPNECVGNGPRAIPEEVDPTKLSLPDVIGRFKSMVMKNYSSGVKEKEWSPFYKKLWHRNYYDHIIRNEKDYERIVEYIRLNPENWERDKNNLESLD